LASGIFSGWPIDCQSSFGKAMAAILFLTIPKNPTKQDHFIYKALKMIFFYKMVKFCGTIWFLDQSYKVYVIKMVWFF
jgi:hypothetical protein